MICPKCGTEYREGFNECAYCHIPLVENLEEGVDPEKLYKMSEDPGSEEEEKYLSAEEFIELARKKGLSDRNIRDAIEDARESEGLPPLDASYENSENDEEAFIVKPFKKASDRAEDLRSSAYTLLIVSAAGIIATILFFIGAIPVNFTPAGRYVTTITMGAMFLFFLAAGIKSYKNLGALMEEAEREDKKIEEIRGFFFENYDGEKLDKEAMAESGSDTDDYFVRLRKMKQILNERFMDLDPGFLEYMADSIYNELYEKDAEDDDATEDREEDTEENTEQTL